jgi:hypothetical protein
MSWRDADADRSDRIKRSGVRGPCDGQPYRAVLRTTTLTYSVVSQNPRFTLPRRRGVYTRGVVQPVLQVLALSVPVQVVSARRADAEALNTHRSSAFTGQTQAVRAKGVGGQGVLAQSRRAQPRFP